MRVVLTVWNGRIAPVFDVARNALVLEAEDGVVKSRCEEALRLPGSMQQTVSLMELKPDVLVCGAISRALLDAVQAAGVRVFPFVAGDVEDVIAAYFEGTLTSSAHAMPGCCGRGRLARTVRAGRQGCRARWRAGCVAQEHS